MKRIYFLILLLAAGLNAQDKQIDLPRLSSSVQEDVTNRTLVNINNISMWVYANGNSGINPDGDSGVIFPRGTAGVIFADGLEWGGQVSDGAEPLVRAGGARYRIGTVPGAIISPGVGEDFSEPVNVNRIWRVRRDYFNADLQRDAAEFWQVALNEVSEEQIAQVRSIYARDWRDWPWQKGAPFYDAEADAVYTPQFNSDGSPRLFPDADEPGLFQADQVVWFVVNDLDPGSVQTFAGSPAIGLEVQVTLWAYKNPETIQNIIFKHYKVIYKGTSRTPASAVIDSMYLAQWSDPDIGSFGDDFFGSDASRAAAYAYNAEFTDAMFSSFSIPPPVAGYTLLSGPAIPDPRSVGFREFKRQHGVRNNPLVTVGQFFTFLDEGGPSRFTDYSRTRQLWNMLRGYKAIPELPLVPWIDPHGNRTRFVFSGDPLTGTGWLDSNPGDRRFIMSTGPFSLALGDTNEMTIALVAGLGSDNLTGIGGFRFGAEVARQAFEARFDFPEPPAQPVVTATPTQEGIILDWSSGQEAVERVETAQSNGFEFEGYAVYQLPAPDASLSEGVRIATFDRVNGIRIVFQNELDTKLGLPVPTLVQEGTNSGIFRSLQIEKDHLRDEPFINSGEYHFAVTAYNYRHAPLLGKRSLESAPGVVTVIPTGLDPGVRLTASRYDTLPAEHISGQSVGEVIPLVTDPAKLTGDTYEVTFDESGADIGWNLRNVSKNNLLLTGIKNQSGDTDYLNLEGVKVVVKGPPLRGLDWSFAGSRWISRAPSDSVGSPGNLMFGAVYLGPNFFGSALTADAYVNVHMEWFSMYSFTDLNGTGDYNIGEPYLLSPTDGHQKAFLYRTLGAGNYEGFFDVPFNAFDSEADPPRQLNVLVHDPDGNSQWDLDKRYLPTDPRRVAINDGDFRFNYVFIMDTNYDQAGRFYDPGSGGIDAFENIKEGGQPVLWVGWWGRRGSRILLQGGFTLDFVSPHVNSARDVFRFQTSAPSFSQGEATAKILNLVNVFPNPYRGHFRPDSRFQSGVVTFNHLPQKATVRIFTLAGIQVRILEKDSPGQFLTWDLKNMSGRTVANGIYVAHIDMPEIGVSKNLKLLVFL